MTTVTILALLFILSLKFNIFDLKGSIAALLIGIIVVIFGSLLWLILMLIFAITAYIATKYKIKEKIKNHLQEGKNGERHVSNVIYAALIGIFIAFANITKFHNLPFFEIFATSFASVNADTFASEIGVFDKNVYLITNFKKITPGINGGISLLGEISAAVGALIIGLSYSILEFHTIVFSPIFVITLLGFAGCQVDSILGAVFENRNKLSKGQVNTFSTLFAVFLSILIYI